MSNSATPCRLALWAGDILGNGADSYSQPSPGQRISDTSGQTALPLDSVGNPWNGSLCHGPHPEDGQELVVRDEMPPGFPYPDLEEELQLASSGDIDPEMISYYAKS